MTGSPCSNRSADVTRARSEKTLGDLEMKATSSLFRMSAISLLGLKMFYGWKIAPAALRCTFDQVQSHYENTLVLLKRKCISEDAESIADGNLKDVRWIQQACRHAHNMYKTHITRQN